MTSRHNKKGSLSPEEIARRDIYCDRLAKIYEQRNKLASLKNLLKPTPTLVKVRPSESEVKSKILQEKLESVHLNKPGALRSLRDFQSSLDIVSDRIKPYEDEDV